MIVDIPYSKTLSYKLFSQGCTFGVPHVDNNGFVNFTYPPKTVIVLFYTFKDFRRAYIVTEDKNNITELSSLPGVREPIKIIYIAKGRKVDHLKRCLFLLTQRDKYEIFKFPLIFWYKLSSLIQFSGAKNSDITILYNQFKKTRRNNKNRLK